MCSQLLSYGCSNVISYVCSSVLSHVCCHMCSQSVLSYVVSFVLSSVCSYVLSHVPLCVCSHMCAPMCMLSAVCSYVLLYVCSHDTVSFSQFHPPHCLGSLAGIVFWVVTYNDFSGQCHHNGPFLFSRGNLHKIVNHTSVRQGQERDGFGTLGGILRDELPIW